MNNDASEAIIGAAIAILLPALVGTAAGWPMWLIIVLALVLLGAAAWIINHRRHQRLQQILMAEHARGRAVPPPPPPAAPEPPAQRVVPQVTLPSAAPDFPFVLTCTVQWQRHDRSGGDHADLGAIAAESVLTRARQVTAAHRPEDETAAHVLASVLGHPMPDPGQLVVAWATQVTLAVGDKDRDHLRRAADLRKQQHLWEQEIAVERARRSYLGDEVLTSTGSTVVWWLARHTDQVKETVDLIGTLAQLSAASRNDDVDEAFRHLLPEHLRRPVAAHTEHRSPAFAVNGDGVVVDNGFAGSFPEQRSDNDDLVPDPEDPQNTLFGHQFATLLDRHDHPDRAAETRRRFGADEWSDEDTGEEGS